MGTCQGMRCESLDQSTQLLPHLGSSNLQVAMRLEEEVLTALSWQLSLELKHF